MKNNIKNLLNVFEQTQCVHSKFKADNLIGVNAETLNTIIKQVGGKPFVIDAETSGVGEGSNVFLVLMYILLKMNENNDPRS